MSVVHNGRKIDLRVATLPTVWGEKVVMRILDNSTASLDLRDLSFLDEQLRDVPRVVHQAVRHDPGHRPDRFRQVDDAVRDAQRGRRSPRSTSSRSRTRSSTASPGINQVQVNPKAGLTFAGALRSILRSDPDVVLLGEIRDHETAQIAIEAALTGHLVLSTLHTNDAPVGRSPASPRWASSRSSSARRSTASSPSGSRAGSATSARQPYTPTPEEMLARPVPVGRRASRCPSSCRPVGCVDLLEDRLPRAARAARGHARDRGDRAARRRALVERRHRRDRASSRA